MAGTTPNSSETVRHQHPLPRVTIQFCTQCKWMLRAAYFAQELLSTFSTSLGEVALQPRTGGTFIVTIITSEVPPLFSGTSSSPANDAPNLTPTINITSKILWDRKLDGGFPETKELKRRVRDVIDPTRNLGHVDRNYPSAKEQHTGAGTDAVAATTTAAAAPAAATPAAAATTTTTTSTGSEMASLSGNRGKLDAKDKGQGEGKNMTRSVSPQSRWGGGPGGHGGCAEQKVLLHPQGGTGAAVATAPSSATTTSPARSAEPEEEDARNQQLEPLPLAPHLRTCGAAGRRGIKLPPGNEAVKARMEEAASASASAPAPASSSSFTDSGRRGETKGEDERKKCDDDGSGGTAGGQEVCVDCD